MKEKKIKIYELLKLIQRGKKKKMFCRRLKTTQLKLSLRSKVGDVLVEDFKAESQLIRVQRETCSCVPSGLCSRSSTARPSDQPSHSVSCFLKAELLRARGSLDGGGGGSISVLCVWLRPDSFVRDEPKQQHNVSVAVACQSLPTHSTVGEQRPA